MPATMDSIISTSSGTSLTTDSKMELYTEVQTLGRGAYGVATLVKLRKGGRDERKKLRVVKQINLSGMASSSQMESLKEVGVLKQLDHRNIVHYYDDFFEDGTLRIVMEFADGGDLSSHVKRRKETKDRYKEDDIMTMIAQCMLALQYIHQRRILHRDIKSQNIFLMKDSTVKLGDFGISRVLENTAAQAGTVVGTPAYLAPELCENQPYNHKADIWSTGVVLHELFNLQLPWESHNIAALVMKIVTADPPPIPEEYSDEAHELMRLVLLKQPDKRPSADECLLMPVVHCCVPAELELTATGMEQFEVLRELGRGAFGVASLAKYVSGGRHGMLCVIKRVNWSMLGDSEQRGAQAEVDVLRRLSYPHIIAYFDAFVEDMMLHIVLQFADGGDLAAEVKRRRDAGENFSQAEAVTMFGHCLLGLQYIHDKRILHRDIKCQNIFLMKSGTTKLGDFGISKVLETGQAAQTVIGTTAYLAPEICENLPYGSKADIWALGIVFYEVLALQLPFNSRNVAARVMAIISQEPAPLPDRYGAEVHSVVQQALRKKPDERPGADELLRFPVVSEMIALERSSSGYSPKKVVGKLPGAGSQADCTLGNEATGFRMTSSDWTMTPMENADGATNLGGAASALDSITGEPVLCQGEDDLAMSLRGSSSLRTFNQEETLLERPPPCVPIVSQEEEEQQELHRFWIEQGGGSEVTINAAAPCEVTSLMPVPQAARDPEEARGGEAPPERPEEDEQPDDVTTMLPGSGRLPVVAKAPKEAQPPAPDKLGGDESDYGIGDGDAVDHFLQETMTGELRPSSTASKKSSLAMQQSFHDAPLLPPAGGDPDAEGSSFSRPSTSDSVRARRSREAEKNRQFEEEQRLWRELQLQRHSPGLEAEDPAARAKRIKKEAQDQLYQEELARLQAEEPLIFSGSPPAHSGAPRATPPSRPASGRSNTDTWRRWTRGGAPSGSNDCNVCPATAIFSLRARLNDCDARRRRISARVSR